VAAVSAVVVWLVLLLGGCALYGSGEQVPASEAGDVQPGWRQAPEPLTPQLADPAEVLAVGTYPLRPGGERCEHWPVRALEDLGPEDALVVVYEVRSGIVPARFPPLDQVVDTPVQAGTNRFCVPSERRRDAWFPFAVDGRAFHALVALGPEASAGREAEARSVLADFRAP
jgi:hypothetical protein